MNCRRVNRWLEQVADGSAPAAQREAVESHAAGCPGCARRLRESRLLLGMLADSPARRVGENFERRLFDAVRDCPHASPLAAWWERTVLLTQWRLRGGALLAAGSLAAAVLVVGIAPRLGGLDGREPAPGARDRFVQNALERHHELEEASSQGGWEDLDGGLRLSAGVVVTE